MTSAFIILFYISCYFRIARIHLLYFVFNDISIPFHHSSSMNKPLSAQVIFLYKQLSSSRESLQGNKEIVHTVINVMDSHTDESEVSMLYNAHDRFSDSSILESSSYLTTEDYYEGYSHFLENKRIVGDSSRNCSRSNSVQSCLNTTNDGITDSSPCDKHHHRRNSVAVKFNKPDYKKILI
ncbi:hypothetical protein KAFR_0F00840 [Kazachstania africana CBS 2517]|uniref:Uncharacterized protein n=1 Tax=Kazachstania africana (strain ATCC 22294 / BCRC 22015 / CBS 2517 / CECT 1963 / NBRC 1671 / NRRL Y-8276) TaxID=1071382 RepID=H2AWD1_KAZAF|nr:hypothetical protein KAFR_0F00840 [Kazachstania africana CBS 2517]CCF58681.1 hypothetical protein KAFR_0F00840 [Kazachstania africana CBS 2517]